MIAKVTKGRSFRGVLDYALHQEKGYLLATNMVGQTPQELAAEFGQIRKFRPGLGKAVCHVQIALAPEENLDDNQWLEVVDAYKEQMGFGDCQFVAVKHTNTNHQHIHIILNRINVDGNVVSDSHDYRRQEAIMRQLETKLNLTPVPNSHEVGRKSYSKGEIERVLRTGEPSVKMHLHDLIDDILQKTLLFDDFTNQLALCGVEARLNQASTGRVSGISFAIGGVAVKGSDLGKAYSWNGLQKRGLIYGTQINHSQTHEFNHDKKGGERYGRQSGTKYSNGNHTSSIAEKRIEQTGNAKGNDQGSSSFERFYQELRNENIAGNTRNEHVTRKRRR